MHQHHHTPRDLPDWAEARGRSTRRRRGDFPDASGDAPFGPRAYRHHHGGHPEGHEHGERGYAPGGRGFGGPGGYGPGFGGGPSFGPGGPGFGPGGPGFGPGGPRGRRGGGRRAGRGDIRAAVLLLLAEQPMHGYQLIQEIAERSGGQWRPSPGAIYPALSMLEDEGLVSIAVESGRKLATLTDAGRTYVEEHADALGTPFDDAAARPTHPGRALRGSLEALGGAAVQVVRTGTDEQAQQALAILDRARRDLYLLLAGEAPTTDAPNAPTSGPADA